MTTQNTTIETTNNKKNGFAEILRCFGGGRLELSYEGVFRVANMTILYALTNKDAHVYIRFAKSVKTRDVFIESITWDDLYFHTVKMEDGCALDYWVNIDPREPEARRVCVSPRVQKDEYYPLHKGLEVLGELLRRVDENKLYDWDYANL